MWGLVALLAIAGAGHFAAPQLLEGLIPDALGNPRAWVLASGGAELACAVAVAVPRTRRVGALAAGALFVAVFPGNVVMALDSLPAARTGASAGVVGAVLAWGRLPLQVPLVLWALGIARRAR